MMPLRAKPVFGLAWITALGVGLLSQRICADEQLGIRVPDGFEVTLFANDELAHDIFSMTLDSRGRVVVAGAGYIKTLHDDDSNGQADRATLFSSLPKSGAHGMCFDGNDLLCTGDNGLLMFHDRDGDGAADGDPERWATLAHPEHGANGVVRGPDGWFYVICGNDAGVSADHATSPRSPVREPQCGAVVRFSPDGKQSEVVAHGFRNPYDLDFNAAGHLFTVDADGERDQYLPWYAPTRLFDVAQGMHHGWMLKGWQRSWNRPQSFFDNVERLVEIGRGSPTGLKVYRHRTFPKQYRGGVFSCCWTLGRIYFFPLMPQGSTYSSRAEVILETTGEVGFAPVDIAVGTKGEMYVAIGGRGTRGSVFCVRYVGPNEDGKEPPSGDALSQVLDADEPLSAWSRAVWVPKAKEIGERALLAAALDSRRTPAQRMRAIEVLVDLFDGLPADAMAKLVADENGQIAARAAWAIAHHPHGNALANLARCTHHKQAVAARAAWEALETFPNSQPTDCQVPKFASDRRVRTAAWRVLGRSDETNQLYNGKQPDQVVSRLSGTALNGQLTRADFPMVLAAFTASQDNSVRLVAVRLMQMALGDMRLEREQFEVYAGYGRGDAEPLTAEEAAAVKTLAEALPSGSPDLDRELARLLGMLAPDDAAILERVVAQCTNTSREEDDLHYLTVLSRLGGERSKQVTQRTAKAVVGLQIKLAAGEMVASRNWPLRVGEVVEELGRRDPALQYRITEEPQFRLPAHSMLTASFSNLAQSTAARRLMDELAADLDVRWTPELVTLVATLPATESLPALRLAWDDFTVRDSIARVLARTAEPVDRPWLIEALASAEPEVVLVAAQALAKFDNRASDEELLAIFSAFRQACLAPQQQELRAAFAALLGRWTGTTVDAVESPGRDVTVVYERWLDWLVKNHPKVSQRLSGVGGADRVQWEQRVASVGWDDGNAERGRVVFEKRACHKCHAGNARFGPTLVGVAGRLSTGDLIAAIVDPTREVAPLYQTTQVVTGSGKSVVGFIVYESPEGTLVQTSPETTVRVAGDEIVAMQKSRQSLMPNGLLNGATDEELADLVAYLKTLKPQK